MSVGGPSIHPHSYTFKKVATVCLASSPPCCFQKESVGAQYLKHSFSSSLTLSPLFLLLLFSPSLLSFSSLSSPLFPFSLLPLLTSNFCSSHPPLFPFLLLFPTLSPLSSFPLSPSFPLSLYSLSPPSFLLPLSLLPLSPSLPYSLSPPSFLLPMSLLPLSPSLLSNFPSTSPPFSSLLRPLSSPSLPLSSLTFESCCLHSTPLPHPLACLSTAGRNSH